MNDERDVRLQQTKQKVSVTHQTTIGLHTDAGLQNLDVATAGFGVYDDEAGYTIFEGLDGTYSYSIALPSKLGKSAAYPPIVSNPEWMEREHALTPAADDLLAWVVVLESLVPSEQLPGPYTS